MMNGVQAVKQQQQYGLSDPPPGVPYDVFLRTWNDDHVARWLAHIRCDAHQHAFRANDIRGDVLLELDQHALNEIGVPSIGDRLRILNAVKVLRLKVSARPLAHRSAPAPDTDSKADAAKGANRRLENVRPAPLQLNPNANRGDLPAIIREQAPDSASARGASLSQQQPQQQSVRPLPMPTQSTPPSNTQLNTPSSAHSLASTARSHLPPLPPPPRGQPPLPPSRPGANRNWSAPQLDAPSQPPPPPPSANWVNHHLPADPRPGNPGGKSISRSISPVPPARLRSAQTSGLQGLHGRNSSLSNNSGSPSKRPVANNAHPYANVQPALLTPSNLASNLSPIDESFSHQSSTSTPSPPTQSYVVGRGPFNPANAQYSLDDLRRKLIKFTVPDEGLKFTIDVAECKIGVDVFEKVLKKIGKGSIKSDGNLDVSSTEEGGLVVDGWGVCLDDEPDHVLTEAELLSIISAPEHPTRETGLPLHRIRHDRSGSPGSNISSRSTKRASAISILSGLGVRDPERTLEPPSPTSDRLAPVAQAKRPSKLRNFFGQRPPSELITTHLTEFFPNAEKKVLARTARHSMMRRRESIASSFQQPLPSRFSSSTQGSRGSTATLHPPPVPDKSELDMSEDLPRVSLSTDDGRSVDLHLDGRDSLGQSALPPIPFPTSDDDTDVPSGSQRQRPISRTLSTASKRMSFMTELRSKRDRSDTASLMTVDEITAEVESRRVSKSYNDDDLSDGWTKVDTEIENIVPKAVAEDSVDEEELESDLSEEEDETLRDADEELALDVDEDGIIHNVVTEKRANKWIKGALIGAGSFGKVYLGMDASNGLLMAVKQVELPTGSAPNQERKKSMLSALEREIELLKNLQHENIVQYLYSSIDEEYLNIFLEYVPGGSVTALLRNYGAFEEPLVKNFVRQILAGLDYLHERDIIHRDIKGANILVDNKGGIKISDFGISKKVDDNLLSGNKIGRASLQGSVFWMAPEVVKQTGHTRKADIWSVGCLVVEMLTGEHPWAQLTQMQAIFKIGSSARPTIPSDISAEAQDFLQKTFEINHEARPSAVELLQHPWIDVKSAKGV